MAIIPTTQHNWRSDDWTNIHQNSILSSSFFLYSIILTHNHNFNRKTQLLSLTPTPKESLFGSVFNRIGLPEMDSEDKRIEDQLSHPILLSERVRSAVDEAQSFKLECAEVAKQVDRLAQMLRMAVRFATSSPAVYERPIRRVVAEVSKNLERALTLVRKCKHQSALRRVMTITSVTDFRKLLNLLDASVGDMKWLLTIFECNGGGIVLSLPPIASNDPIIAWVWSSIASIQMGQLPDRIEGTNELASLAADNERNKNIIVEEGGIPPLLKLASSWCPKHLKIIF